MPRSHLKAELTSPVKAADRRNASALRMLMLVVPVFGLPPTPKGRNRGFRSMMLPFGLASSVWIGIGSVAMSAGFCRMKFCTPGLLTGTTKRCAIDELLGPLPKLGD